VTNLLHDHGTRTKVKTHIQNTLGKQRTTSAIGDKTYGLQYLDVGMQQDYKSVLLIIRGLEHVR